MVAQSLLFPDVWESCAGPEPMLGPIEAPDAQSAYHAAVRTGCFPAGPVFGVSTSADQRADPRVIVPSPWEPRIRRCFSGRRPACPPGCRCAPSGFRGPSLVPSSRPCPTGASAVGGVALISRPDDADPSPAVGVFVLFSELLSGVALVVVMAFLLHVFLGG